MSFFQDRESARTWHESLPDEEYLVYANFNYEQRCRGLGSGDQHFQQKLDLECQKWSENSKAEIEKLNQKVTELTEQNFQLKDEKDAEGTRMRERQRKESEEDAARYKKMKTELEEEISKLKKEKEKEEKDATEKMKNAIEEAAEEERKKQQKVKDEELKLDKLEIENQLEEIKQLKEKNQSLKADLDSTQADLKEETDKNRKARKEREKDREDAVEKEREANKNQLQVALEGKKVAEDRATAAELQRDLKDAAICSKDEKIHDLEKDKAFYEKQLTELTQKNQKSASELIFQSKPCSTLFNKFNN